MGPLHKRRWKGALRRRPIIMVRRRAGMVGVVMTLLCLTQLLSISEANVPEAAVSAPADIIPKEVHETLQASSDLLQDPEDFVEGLSASPNAAHRAAKANKQIMSADDAISALAKRTKKELKGDLSAKSVASLKPVHLHRSRAAKKAAKKIAAQSEGSIDVSHQEEKGKEGGEKGGEKGSEEGGEEGGEEGEGQKEAPPPQPFEEKPLPPYVESTFKGTVPPLLQQQQREGGEAYLQETMRQG